MNDFLENARKDKAEGNTLHLICMGDIFQQNNPRTDLILWFMVYINKLAEVFESLHFIPGNHDFRVDGYATDFIREMKSDKVFYYDMQASSFCNKIAGLNCFFMPFFDPEKEDISYPDFIQKNYTFSEKGVMFSHLYDKYAKSGSESDIITKLVSNIDFNEFSKYFDIIFSGHVHTYQEYVTREGVQVTYPGTIQALTGHDVGLEKKYCVLEPLGSSTVTKTWIPTKHIMFIERDFKENDLLDDLDPLKEYVIYLDIKAYPNDLGGISDWVNLSKKNNPNIKYINIGKAGSSSDSLLLSLEGEIVIESFETILERNMGKDIYSKKLKRITYG